MKVISYYCSHCQNRFEAEQKDILECPRCYWSSSVKPADEVGEKAPFKQPVPDKQHSSFSLTPHLPKIVKLSVFLLVVVALGFLLRRGCSSLQEQSTKRQESRNISAPAEEASIEISQADRNILMRRTAVSSSRALNDGEEKILGNFAAFQTGFIEKLPSQPWSLETFKEMVEKQEELYKLPFARSYKKKLYSLIEEKYVPSLAAFEAGDLLLARNLWIESLIIPMYSADLQKHRAVALTMLKPFINDTLSKIAAVNSMLIEQQIRTKEQEVNRQYMALHETLNAQNWVKAMDTILSLERQIDELQKPDLIVTAPPPYPPAVARVDRDVQIPLVELLSTPTPPVTDLGPLRVDLSEKRKVVQSFLAAHLSEQEKMYQEALDQITRGEWLAAVRSLEQIEFPETLVSDARDKIEVIKKNQLESGSYTLETKA